MPEDIRSAAFGRWREEVAAAEEVWLNGLPQEIRGLAEQALRQGERDAETFVGQTLGLLPRGDGSSTPPSRAAAGLILDGCGSDDPEHPDSPGQVRLQTRLCDLVAGSQICALRHELELRGDWSGLRRLDDLRADGTDHTWLWAVSQGSHGLMAPSDFCCAVRLRLGADVLPEDIVLRMLRRTHGQERRPHTSPRAG